MTTKTTSVVAIGDIVFPTDKAVREHGATSLAELWTGGTVTKLEGEVAEIRITKVYKVHVSKLTKGGPSDPTPFDPVP